MAPFQTWNKKENLQRNKAFEDKVFDIVMNVVALTLGASDWRPATQEEDFEGVDAWLTFTRDAPPRSVALRLRDLTALPDYLQDRRDITLRESELRRLQQGKAADYYVFSWLKRCGKCWKVKAWVVLSGQRLHVRLQTEEVRSRLVFKVNRDGTKFCHLPVEVMKDAIVAVGGDLKKKVELGDHDAEAITIKVTELA